MCNSLIDANIGAIDRKIIFHSFFQLEKRKLGTSNQIHHSQANISKCLFPMKCHLQYCRWEFIGLLKLTIELVNNHID